MHKNYSRCRLCNGWIANDSWERHAKTCSDKANVYITAPVDSERERALRAIEIARRAIGSDMLAHSNDLLTWRKR